ncbi:MAG: helix-turn-helix transcriptional regulator [Daejeonella sp.]
MSIRTSLLRYTLVINKLRSRACDFEEIRARLERESDLRGEDLVVSKRTFQRDIEEIRSLCNICIQYDFSRRVYFIDDAGEPELSGRMLEAFDLFNTFNIAAGLSGYVHFEKRRSAGTENLYGLLHAIKNRLIIGFTYEKFWNQEVSQRIVNPLLLKEFKNRWYILTKDSKGNKIKTFALDRLSDLEITKKHFAMPVDFDAEKTFRFCFGIINPEDEEPEEIILSFTPTQGKYIKTLPLHESQEILTDNADELRLKLNLCITHDLIMELLSYGPDMKVLQPASLAGKIRQTHKKAFAQY